jgi:hypothetical protein
MVYQWCMACNGYHLGRIFLLILNLSTRFPCRFRFKRWVLFGFIGKKKIEPEENKVPFVYPPMSTPSPHLKYIPQKLDERWCCCWSWAGQYTITVPRVLKGRSGHVTQRRSSQPHRHWYEDLYIGPSWTACATGMPISSVDQVGVVFAICGRSASASSRTLHRERFVISGGVRTATSSGISLDSATYQKVWIQGSPRLVRSRWFFCTLSLVW